AQALPRSPPHVRAAPAVPSPPAGRPPPTRSADRTLGLWDADTGRLAGRFRGHTSRVTAVAFAPGGKLAASTGKNEKVVRLWSPATGEPVRELTGGRFAFASVAFSPDGRTVAAGEGVDRDTFPSGAKMPDGAVRLWDPNTGKELRQLHAGSGRANALAYSPDGRLLATAGLDDGAVHIWDPNAGTERARFERAPD